MKLLEEGNKNKEYPFTQNDYFSEDMNRTIVFLRDTSAGNDGN